MPSQIDILENGVILDTDVVSYIFDNKEPAKAFSPYLIGREIAISFITLGEVYRGAYKNNWGNNRLLAWVFRSSLSNGSGQ
jgi:predicted nucleic acid-binding protein